MVVIMDVKTLPREFTLKKGGTTIRLSDPNPAMKPSEVMDFYSSTYPELTNASVSGPDAKTNKLVFEFSTVVGKKG